MRTDPEGSFMRAKALFVTFSLIATAALLAGDQAVPGAKDLFFDPTQGTMIGAHVQPVVPTPSEPAKPARVAGGKTALRRPLVRAAADQVPVRKNRGLHYWIELENPGAQGDYVTGRQVFRSGQRIRLHFVSNADGRILLIQLGASGASSLLFPAPSQGLADNGLKAGEDRILPSDSHWFRFDSRVGTERLLVLFARDTEELDRFKVKPEMGSQETRTLVAAATHVAGSKDLVIETETRKASEIGTYGINLQGDPVVLQIELQHR
jgi:Domain of unknown function (DUF4384)